MFRDKSAHTFLLQIIYFFFPPNSDFLSVLDLCPLRISTASFPTAINSASHQSLYFFCTSVYFLYKTVYFFTYKSLTFLLAKLYKDSSETDSGGADFFLPLLRFLSLFLPFLSPGSNSQLFIYLFLQTRGRSPPVIGKSEGRKRKKSGEKRK